MHAYIHTYIHAYMYTCIHAYMHTYMLYYACNPYLYVMYMHGVRVQLHTHTDAYRYTCARTCYIYSHVRVQAKCGFALHFRLTMSLSVPCTSATCIRHSCILSF